MTAPQVRRRAFACSGVAVALAVALVGSAEACGFEGEGKLTVPAPSAESGADVFSSLPPDGPGSDAAVDAADAALTCPPLFAVPPDAGDRQAVAVRRRAAPSSAADGGPDAASDAGADADGAAFPDTSAWRGCTAFILDRSTAARESKDADGGTVQASARVALEWDESALYVAVDVDDAHVEGTSADPSKNDGVEIYASGFGTTRTGDYMSYDHHYIVDHAGQSNDYPTVGTSVPFPGGIAIPTPAGYRVEARIDVSQLGGVLVAGETLYFDLLLNDNDGITQSKYLIWAMTPHATCSCTACACNYSPAYDTLLFAPIQLVP